MLNIGGWELLVIMLAALLVLGPERLPEAARQIGRALRELRKVTTGFQRELNNAMRDPVGAVSSEQGPAADDSPSDPFDGKVGTANAPAADPDPGPELDDPEPGISSDR